MPDTDESTGSTLEWRTSRRSGGGNDCVEIAYTGTGAAVRDSKHREGGIVRVGRAAWGGVLYAARHGALDRR